jgi:hypothetical protein
METLIVWFLDKAMAFIKFSSGYRTPSLTGRMEKPVFYRGKKVYPVYLTLEPGTSDITFENISCNCSFYLPDEEYGHSLFWDLGSEQRVYRPDQKAPNPYIKSIPLNGNGLPKEELFFVDPQDNPFIEFKIRSQSRFFIARTLTWKQSVV